MLFKVAKRSVLALTAAAALVVAGGTATAADFAGKTVNMIIPFRAGGGTDVWARFFATEVVKNLPGNPELSIKNVPGGGSITGTNQFEKLARPDGLTTIAISGSTQLAKLLDDPRVQYDYGKWKAIVASPTGGLVMVRSDVGAKTVKDLAGKPLKFASQPANSLDLVALLAFDLLKLDVQPMFGIKGRNDGRVALEKGEASLDYQTTSAVLEQATKSLLDSGTAVPLFSFGIRGPGGKIQRDPAFPNVPSMVEAYEMIHGKPPSGPDWEAYIAVYDLSFGMQKMICLPPETPDDIVADYEKAMATTLSNPEFKAKAAAELGDYPQLQAKAATEALQRGAAISQEAKRWVQGWLKDKYGITPGTEVNN